MERRLIGQHIKFKRYAWKVRYWHVDGHLHRDDGNPAYENINTGRCEWWKQGKCVRDNWWSAD